MGDDLFPDFGTFSTGNPYLDYLSGYDQKKKKKKEKEWGAKQDPLVANNALPEAQVAPEQGAPESLLQQKKFVNPQREAERKRKEALKRAAAATTAATTAPEEGRGAGGGVATYSTAGGGFKKGRRIGTKGWA